MQTKNVYYAQPPEKVIVTANGNKAMVEIPVNISRIENEEQVLFMAETVYSVATANTSNLKERVMNNIDAWIEIAKKTEPQEVSMSDVVDAINALTDIVLGGGF